LYRNGSKGKQPDPELATMENTIPIESPESQIMNQDSHIEDAVQDIESEWASNLILQYQMDISAPDIEDFAIQIPLLSDNSFPSQAKRPTVQTAAPTPQIEISTPFNILELLDSSYLPATQETDELTNPPKISPLSRNTGPFYLPPIEKYYFGFLQVGGGLPTLHFHLTMRLLFQQDNVLITCPPVRYATLVFLSKIQNRDTDTRDFQAKFNSCLHNGTEDLISIARGWLTMACQSLCSGDTIELDSFREKLKSALHKIHGQNTSICFGRRPICYPRQMWGGDSNGAQAWSILRILLTRARLKHIQYGNADIDSLHWVSYFLGYTLSSFLKKCCEIRWNCMAFVDASDDLRRMLSTISQWPLGQVLQEKIASSGKDAHRPAVDLLATLCEAVQDPAFASQVTNSRLEWINIRLVLTPLLEAIFFQKTQFIRRRETVLLTVLWCKLLSTLRVNPWSRLSCLSVNSQREVWSSIICLTGIILRGSDSPGNDYDDS